MFYSFNWHLSDSGQIVIDGNVSKIDNAKFLAGLFDARLRLSGSNLELFNNFQKTIFNEDMSGYNGKIYLESGSTLQLGYDGKISNTSLKSNDGTLNLINGKINDSADVSPTFFSGYAFLEIDATLSGNSSIGDKFAPISADFHNDGNNYYYSGVTLTNVNITNNLITDNTGTFTVISASNGPCPNLYADLKVTQNGKTIKFTENQTSLNDTLNDTDIDYEIFGF